MGKIKPAIGFAFGIALQVASQTLPEMSLPYPIWLVPLLFWSSIGVMAFCVVWWLMSAIEAGFAARNKVSKPSRWRVTYIKPPKDW